MYHASGGLYFEQGTDGAVVVIVKQGDAENAPVIRDVTIAADAWACVVAAMAGETAFAEPAPAEPVPEEPIPEEPAPETPAPPAEEGSGDADQSEEASAEEVATATAEGRQPKRGSRKK